MIPTTSRTLFTTVATSAAFTLASCADAQAPARIDPRPPAQYAQAADSVRARARTLIERAGLAGLSVAVGIDGQVMWAEGFGYADVAQEIPVTPSTRFRVGSTAKPMTAAAAVLLAERGQLDLDAPIQKYVPGFPAKAAPISVRQLLSQLSGIRHYVAQGEVIRSTQCTEPAEGLATFAADSLVAPPGTRFHYSTYGYVLAGAAVAAAAKEPFLTFMQRNIFDPLGMKHTGPDSPEERAPVTATPYGPRQLRAPSTNDSCILGAGGLLSTPSDLVRFGMGLLGETLFTAKARDMMWTEGRTTSANAGSDAVADSTGRPTAYGLGWYVRSIQRPGDSTTSRLIGHPGSSIGGMTSWMIYPEDGLVVAVTANATQAEGLPQLGAYIAAQFQAAHER